MARRARGAAVLAGALAAATGSAQAAGTAHAAALGRGAVYGGHTAGAAPYPVVVRLNAGRTAVARVVTAFHAPCTSGLAFNLVDNGSGPFRVGATGRFTARHPGEFTLGKGITAVTAVTVRGRVTGRSSSGTVALSVSERDPDGAEVATCRTSARFTARSAPGRIYAGATSQDGPVVIELSPARGRVAHLRVGWQSTCQSGAEFQVADDQTNFRITAARFGDAYAPDPYPIAGGGHGTDSYAVQGTVRRRRASGTFRVTTAEVDAAGAPTDSCDSGPLTFRARSG